MVLLLTVSYHLNTARTRGLLPLRRLPHHGAHKAAARIEQRGLAAVTNPARR